MNIGPMSRPQALYLLKLMNNEFHCERPINKEQAEIMHDKIHDALEGNVWKNAFSWRGELAPQCEECEKKTTVRHISSEDRRFICDSCQFQFEESRRVEQ